MEDETDYSAHVDAYADWVIEVIPEKLLKLLWIFDVPYEEYRRVANYCLKIQQEMNRSLH